MKKFLSWCCMLLFAVVISTVGATALVSCDKVKEVTKQPSIETQVEICVNDIVNPVFMTLDDAVGFQKTLKSNAFVDSVFLSLSEKTLRDATNVCMKRLHNVQKSDIVGEFLQNRHIYENLPAPPDNASNANTTTESTPPIAKLEIVNEGKTTVTEAPPTRVENGSTTYKDTTIDGKRAIIEKLYGEESPHCCLQRRRAVNGGNTQKH